MAKRMTKNEKILIYIRDNQDDIDKKLPKNRYEKFEDQYNFEEKIRSIIYHATNALLDQVVSINLRRIGCHIQLVVKS